MLIAEKIIELNTDQKFDLIVITVNDNEKYKHYYKRLSNYCNDSIYYVYHYAKFFESFSMFNSFKKNVNVLLNKNTYKNVYLASVDSRHCQYIVSNLDKKGVNLITFDDGTANIVSNSIFLKDRSNIFKKMIMRFLGIKHTIDSLKEKSVIHYTIYNNVNNVFKNLRFLKLISVGSLENNKEKSDVNIFLGQPFSELFNSNNEDFFNKIMKFYNIKYYFPHPREKRINISNVDVIETPFVFEDYLLKKIIPLGNNVRIYTFISSAALNVVGIEGVNVNFLFNKHLMEKYEDIYGLAHSLRANIINIENVI